MEAAEHIGIENIRRGRLAKLEKEKATIESEHKKGTQVYPVHIPFASCHLHGIFLPPCRTKPATVPGLSATASLVQRLCQKSAFWQSPCVKGAIGQSIFIGGTGNPCEVSTTSNN